VKEAEKEIGEVEKLGGALVTYPSPDYPPLLKQIDDPPLVLYVRATRRS